MKKSPENMEFVRSLTVTNSDGDTVFSLIAQPYCVGMYVCTNSQTQLNIPHKKYPAMIKKMTKEMRADGYTVITITEKMSDYLSIEEINNYILK